MTQKDKNVKMYNQNNVLSDTLQSLLSLFLTIPWHAVSLY